MTGEEVCMREERRRGGFARCLQTLIYCYGVTSVTVEAAVVCVKGGGGGTRLHPLCLTQTLHINTLIAGCEGRDLWDIFVLISHYSYW